jgi:hypothetical protein
MQKDHSTSDSNSWCLCPEGCEIAENEVHVWRADLECEARVMRRFCEHSLKESARVSSCTGTLLRFGSLLPIPRNTSDRDADHGAPPSTGDIMTVGTVSTLLH